MADFDVTPTADEIADAVAADAADGVQNFSDGTNSVGMMSLKDRLEIAERLRVNDSAAKPHFGLRFAQLVPPGGGGT